VIRRGDLSANFDRAEFTCNCGCYFGERGEELDLKLVYALQDVRDLVRRPIRIISGCRCPAHNAAVGGGADSMHLEGKAADIYVEGMAPLELYHTVLLVPVFAGGGIGYGPRNFHVDVRGYRARWSYDERGKTIAWRG
jgi:uncharacterized protein YcbK (DUF882 family)